MLIAASFEREGQYVNLWRINPGRLCTVRIDATDYLGVKGLTPNNNKVAVNLVLGAVEFCNLFSGGPDPAGGRLKKCGRLLNTAYFGPVMESKICYAYGVRPGSKVKSPIGQISPTAMEFATKLGPKG